MEQTPVVRESRQKTDLCAQVRVLYAELLQESNALQSALVEVELFFLLAIIHY